MSMYQDAQSQAISFIYSEDVTDVKMMQSDLLTAFWPISQNQILTKYGTCAGTQ